MTMPQRDASQYGNYGYPCQTCGHLDVVQLIGLAGDAQFPGNTASRRVRLIGGGDTVGVVIWLNDSKRNIWKQFISPTIGCNIMLLEREISIVDNTGNGIPIGPDPPPDNTKWVVTIIASERDVNTGVDLGELWRCDVQFKTRQPTGGGSGTTTINPNFMELKRGPNDLLCFLVPGDYQPHPFAGDGDLPEDAEYYSGFRLVMVSERTGGLIGNDPDAATAYFEQRNYGGGSCKERWNGAAEIVGEGTGGISQVVPLSNSVVAGFGGMEIYDCDPGVELDFFRTRAATFLGVWGNNGNRWGKLQCYCPAQVGITENPGVTTLPGDCFDTGELCKIPISDHRRLYHDGNFYMTDYFEGSTPFQTAYGPNLVRQITGNGSTFDPRAWEFVADFNSPPGLSNVGKYMTNILCGKIYFYTYTAAFLGGNFPQYTSVGGGWRYNILTGQLDAVLPFGVVAGSPIIPTEVVEDKTEGGDGDSVCRQDTCGGLAYPPLCGHCAVLTAPQIDTSSLAGTPPTQCNIIPILIENDGIIPGTCDGEPIPITDIFSLVHYEWCATTPTLEPPGVGQAPGQQPGCPEGSSGLCPPEICDVPHDDPPFCLCENQGLFNNTRICIVSSATPFCVRGVIQTVTHPITGEVIEICCGHSYMFPLNCDLPHPQPDCDGPHGGTPNETDGNPLLTIDDVYNRPTGGEYWCKKINTIVVIDDCNQVACVQVPVAYDQDTGLICCCTESGKGIVTLMVMFSDDLPSFQGYHCFASDGSGNPIPDSAVYAHFICVGSKWGQCVPLPLATTCCDRPCPTEDWVLQARFISGRICNGDHAVGFDFVHLSESWQDLGDTCNPTGGMCANAFGVNGDVFEIRLKSGNCYSKPVRIEL